MTGDEAKAMTPHAAVVFDLTTVARDWQKGGGNHGIVIVQDPHDNDAYLSAHSREAKDKALRPRLELELAAPTKD